MAARAAALISALLLLATSAGSSSNRMGEAERLAYRDEVREMFVHVSLFVNRAKLHASYPRLHFVGLRRIYDTCLPDGRAPPLELHWRRL